MPVLKKSERKIQVVPEQEIPVGDFNVGLSGYDSRSGVIFVSLGGNAKRGVTSATAKKCAQLFEELYVLLKKNGPAETEV